MPFVFARYGRQALGQEAVVLGERKQRAVVDDVALVILAGHRRLHAVVEDLDRHAADGLEGLHMTAQQRLQVLMQDEAREDVPRMAQHQREQPDDARHARLVGEPVTKRAKSTCACWPAGVSKRTSKGLGPLLRPDGRNEALHRRIGADVAALADLAGQPDGAQVGEGRDALAQIVEVGRELAGPADLTRTVDRQLEAARDVFADGLGIAPRAAGDRRDRQALAVKVQNHHEFSKLDHPRRPRPNLFGRNGRRRGESPSAGARPGTPGKIASQGIFDAHIREYSTTDDSAEGALKHPQRDLEPDQRLIPSDVNLPRHTCSTSNANSAITWRDGEFAYRTSGPCFACSFGYMIATARLTAMGWPTLSLV